MTRTPRRRAGRLRQEGSASLEMAILTPPLLALIALAVIVGRVALADAAIDQAAADAARAASISTTPQAATANATAAADFTLAHSGLTCRTLTVSVPTTAAFDVPVGQPASVTATVQCQVDLSDLGLPGAPGTVTETASMTSPLNQYSGR